MAAEVSSHEDSMPKILISNLIVLFMNCRFLRVKVNNFFIYFEKLICWLFPNFAIKFFYNEKRIYLFVGLFFLFLE